MAKLCNIPIRTLHHYDDIDLLKPSKVDDTSGYRYYAHEQISEINSIKYFKAAGFSLKEVKTLIANKNLDNNQRMIAQKLDEIENSIGKYKALKNKLNEYMIGLDDKNTLNRSREIYLTDIEECFVAYSRYKGPSNKDESFLRFTKLNNIIEKNKLHMTGSMMAIYHDDYKNFDYNNADIEVCVKVSNTNNDDKVIRKFGGFSGVVGYHYGGYENITDTYKMMLGWLEKHDLEFIGSAIENYIVDLITTSDTNDYITQIVLPVRKVK